VRRLKLASPKASEIDHDLAVSYSPCSVRILSSAQNASVQFEACKEYGARGNSPQFSTRNRKIHQTSGND
jgi:hypothetical protein